MFYDLCYSYGLVKLFLSNLCVESWAKQTLFSALICCNIWNSPTLRVEKKEPAQATAEGGSVYYSPEYPCTPNTECIPR